jgi:hypothetical protein
VLIVVVSLHLMLSEMNKMKRLSFVHLFLVAEIDGTLQVTSCKGMPSIGSPLPTHQRIMTSFGRRTTLELPHGFLRVMY